MPETITAAGLPPEPQIPSTEGMARKVVKGSIWTLAGTITPLLASFFATPFIIRFLGSEAYGALILVSLIPNYFAFADFGMGIASTKFGSEAYGNGDRKKEGEIVRTAALLGLFSSLFIAIPLILFSHQIVTYLNVPEHWAWEASLGLKLATVSFELGILSSIFNTPQLARLRMDLNSMINAVTRLLMAIATPLVLFLGGKLLAAVVTGFVAAMLMLSMHIIVSSRLLSELLRLSINREVIRSLLKFGGGLVASSVAGVLLFNLEKVFVSRLVSVKALAFYSVAFTFANMATMFSWAMVQSLMPAFSQMQGKERLSELNSLYSRGIRFTIICAVPALVFLAIVAKPFITLWAGKEFGLESTIPLYILLSGLAFNIVAYIPHTSILASGRTDALAKLYWIELIPYVLVVWILTSWFGIIGAAAAWSLRVIVDAAFQFSLARQISELRIEVKHKGMLCISILVMLLPFVAMIIIGGVGLGLLLGALVCCSFYGWIVWSFGLDEAETAWIKKKLFYASGKEN